MKPLPLPAVPPGANPPTAESDLHQVLLREGDASLAMLRMFVLLAEHRSLGKVARTLQMTVSTVSRQLTKLEQLFGERLAVRTPYGVVLTDQGEWVAKRMAGWLTSLDETYAELRGAAEEVRGVLRIGMVGSVGASLLPPVVKNLRGRYPNLEIQAVEKSAEALEELLLRGLLSFVVTATSMKHQDLIARPLWRDDYVAIMTPEHPLAKDPDAFAISQLAREPLALLCPRRALLHALGLGTNGKKGREPLLRSGNFDSVRRLVEAGLAVGIVPQSITRGPPPWQVVRRALAVPAARRDVVLAYGKPLGPETPAATAVYLLSVDWDASFGCRVVFLFQAVREGDKPFDARQSSLLRLVQVRQVRVFRTRSDERLIFLRPKHMKFPHGVLLSLRTVTASSN